MEIIGKCLQAEWITLIGSTYMASHKMNQAYLRLGSLVYGFAVFGRSAYDYPDKGRY